MVYISVPLLVSILINIYLFRFNKVLLKKDKIELVLHIVGNFIMLYMFIVYGVTFSVPSIIDLCFGSMTVVIFIETEYIMKIQNREKIFSDKFMYALMMVQWLTLVIGFYLAYIFTDLIYL